MEYARWVGTYLEPSFFEGEFDEHQWCRKGPVNHVPGPECKQCPGTLKSTALSLHATLNRVYLFVVTGQKINVQARRILCGSNGLAHVLACQV